MTPDARKRGYQPGRFSFNVKGGRCEACSGDGQIRVEMHFLPDVYVTCDVCKGKRYNHETLEVRYRGLNISDVLDMPVREARQLFSSYPVLERRLAVLEDVGLDYIRLGQPATTLSGGEAQRIKISRELGKRSLPGTMYILDEPTTGLHMHEVGKLVTVLHHLVDLGATVVVIEHNTDVILASDYVIDLGPGGGETAGASWLRGHRKRSWPIPNPLRANSSPRNAARGGNWDNETEEGAFSRKAPSSPLLHIFRSSRGTEAALFLPHRSRTSAACHEDGLSSTAHGRDALPKSQRPRPFHLIPKDCV